MKMVLHILQKDITRIKWLILSWLTVIIARGAFNLSLIIDQYQFYSKLREFGWGLEGLEWLLAAILIPLLIQGEALVGTNAFWYTRPISRQTVLASKTLFILLFIILPKMLIQLFVLANNHVGTPYLFLAAPQILWEQIFYILPFILLASLTPNFIRYIITGIILFVGLTLWSSMNYILEWSLKDIYEKLFVNTLISQSNPHNFSLGKSIEILNVLIIILASLFMILNQFLTRHSRRTIRWLVLSMVILYFVNVFWAVDFLKINPIFSSPLNIAHLVSADFNKEKVYIWEGFKDGDKAREKHLMASFPQDIKGLPPRYFARLDRLDHMMLRYPDGYRVWNDKKLNPWESNSLNYAKYQKPLINTLSGTIVVNPYFPKEDPSVWMVDAKSGHFLGHRDQEATYSAQGTYHVYEWQITERIPLGKNHAGKNDLARIKIYDIVSGEHGVGIVLGEMNVNLNLVLKPIASLESWENKEGKFYITEPIYIIRNPKTKEAFLPDDVNVILSNPWSRQMLDVQVKELIFKDENDRQFGTLPKITKDWLADAELIRVEANSVGYFIKPINLAGIRLKQKEEYTEDKDVRRYKYVTGEVQFEYYTKPDGFLCKEYYKSGGLRKEWSQLKTGVAEGPAKEFYDTGELLYEYSYVTNNIDGVVRKYSKDGKIISERIFKQAKDLGPVKETGIKH